MKIELLLNLENFQNISFISNDDKDRLDAYEELLPCVEDWVGYTPFALKLANRLRKILSLDPYEVENGIQDEQFTKETIEIKKQPKNTKKLPANGKYKVANTKCNKCDGYISWDGYDKDNPTPPIHVDKDGNIMGNGDCPEYDGGG